MHGDRCSSRTSPLWRLVAVVGAVAGTAFGFWQAASLAETTVLSPQNAAAIVHGSQIILCIPLTRPGKGHLTGALQVELRDTQGDVVASAERAIDQAEPVIGQRMALDKPATAADKLAVHCRFGGKAWSAPLAKLLLVKGHETALVTGQEFFAGSTGSIRVDVHGVKSITDNVPLPGAEVSVTLKRPTARFSSCLTTRRMPTGSCSASSVSPPGCRHLHAAGHDPLGPRTGKAGAQMKVKSEPRSCSSATSRSISPARSCTCAPWRCKPST